MAKHRTYSIEFKRQVAQEFLAGETLYGLAKRHDVSRNLIRIWVVKFEAGAFYEDAQAADLLQEYEAKIAGLERMVRRWHSCSPVLSGRWALPRLMRNNVPHTATTGGTIIGTW